MPTITLEDLKAGAQIKGLAPVGSAKVVNTTWYGSQAIEVIYETEDGTVKNRLVYETDLPQLEVVTQGRHWSFNSDGNLFKLVSEAYRIQLAHLFDPYLAIHTSLVEPLPHQITAVYGEMLPRQPLRFLLADDPGAGKTIMAGLLMKELLIRGDLERCLIVSPGNLVEQWQDELSSKFGLAFRIFSRDMIEASRTGNPFEENPYLIIRLDMLSRNEDLQAKLQMAKDWDLIICDEAHKMSATFFGGEVKQTQRYKLGRLLGENTRHLLLMSATPHNGKEADFQLFMALLDSDRFEGKFRDGVHKSDVSDMMRRLTKEELKRFDGRPLFPERKAYTVAYSLSNLEAALYHDVTLYVKEEMNRVEKFGPEDQKRRTNVSFALQILQRRLASSPKAIHQSIINRRNRLEQRLNEEKIMQRGGNPSQPQYSFSTKIQYFDILPEDSLDDIESDTPQEEFEALEQKVVDSASAAQTIFELEEEIKTLRKLEAEALKVCMSGVDKKWTKLEEILEDPAMKTPEGVRRKLVIFSEFRDTLFYLAERIRNCLGKEESVVVIHGGIGREDRRKKIEAFKQDKQVYVLLANDAVGEGVNLQRAHLMINYDLPWNPNRLEQRFGRIHRIGQEEVCHLWNLVAHETREGDVYLRLLEKLEIEREALGGRVYDVLGQLFEEKSLRNLLMEAIQYGEDPLTKAKLHEIIDHALDRDRLHELLESHALAQSSMDTSQVDKIRDEMERANARRLQPHFIEAFFLSA
ncbi:MAG: DEAD/DEAH box helicase, partial [Cyanobacteria bacterium]|nr:DEAD/DEAH box helicase [Cyanobacteriota bacterium]